MIRSLEDENDESPQASLTAPGRMRSKNSWQECQGERQSDDSERTIEKRDRREVE